MTQGRSRISKIGMGLGAFLMLLLLWIAAGGPLTEHRYYGCEVCRDSAQRDGYLGIPLPSRTYPSKFGRYYREHIDPNHQHHWQETSFHTSGLRCGRYGCGSLTVWAIPYEAELAIMESLPDRATRRAFCEQFDGPQAHGRHYPACLSLLYAYRDNPNRSDWLKLVKQLGLYPRGFRAVPRSQ